MFKCYVYVHGYNKWLCYQSLPVQYVMTVENMPVKFNNEETNFNLRTVGVREI